MLKQKHLVFDLDKTIFDHSKGEEMSLLEMHKTIFFAYESSFTEFYYKFSEFNEDSWQRFEDGIQDVEETLVRRFRLLAEHYSMETTAEELSVQYANLYVKYCTPYIGADTFLQKLSDLNFFLAVCSNGSEKIQKGKLEYHEMAKYFSYFQFGMKHPFCKPNADFFEFLIANLSVEPSEIIFIGDSLKHDIVPAEKLGMKGLHINENYLNEKQLKWNKLFNQIIQMNVSS